MRNNRDHSEHDRTGDDEKREQTVLEIGGKLGCIVMAFCSLLLQSSYEHTYLRPFLMEAGFLHVVVVGVFENLLLFSNRVVQNE